MTPIAKNSRYAAAQEELNALSLALGKVHAGIADIEAQLRAHNPNPYGDQVAAALEFAKDGKVRAPESITDLQDQHVALRQQAEAVQRAMHESRNSLDVLRAELSAELCRAMEGEHRKIGQRLLANLKEMQALLAEEHAFHDAIESAGYSSGYLRGHYGWPLIDGELLRYRMRELSV